MANYKNLVPTLTQIKKPLQRNLNAISVLQAQIEAQVTASTNTNADYAAELVDARVDSAGDTHSSAGANIRHWQGSLTETNEYLQEQINQLSEAYIEILTLIGNIQTRLNELEF